MFCIWQKLVNKSAAGLIAIGQLRQLASYRQLLLVKNISDPVNLSQSTNLCVTVLLIIAGITIGPADSFLFLQLNVAELYLKFGVPVLSLNIMH